jgi:hypothetical protein
MTKYFLADSDKTVVEIVNAIAAIGGVAAGRSGGLTTTIRCCYVLMFGCGTCLVRMSVLMICVHGEYVFY